MTNTLATQNQNHAPQVQPQQPSGDLVGTSHDRGIQRGESYYTDRERQQLRALIGDDTVSDGDLDMLNIVSTRAGLDPFLKEIYLVGRKTKTGGYRGEPAKFETKWTVQTGIDGFRTSSRRYADMRNEAIQIEPTIYFNDQGQQFPFWRKAWGYPVAAQVTVRIGNSSATHTCTWDEYAQGKDEWVGGKKTGKKVLNSMWEQLGPTMLAKCAEAGAHRRVCPLSAKLYVKEEMHQADNEIRETFQATAQRTESNMAAAAEAMKSVTEALNRNKANPEPQQPAQEATQQTPAAQNVTEALELDDEGYPKAIVTGDQDEDLRLHQVIQDIKTRPDTDQLTNLYNALHPTFGEQHAAAMRAALTIRKNQLIAEQANQN